MRLYRIGVALALAIAAFGCGKPTFQPPDLTGSWSTRVGDSRRLNLTFSGGNRFERIVTLPPGPGYGQPVEIVTLADYRVTETTIRLTNIREGSPGPEGRVGGELRIPYRLDAGSLILYPGGGREMKLEIQGAN